MEKLYKKLENGSPIGNLEVRSNIQAIHPDKDLDNKDTLTELGYCEFINNPAPINHNRAKTYINTVEEISPGVWQNVWTMEDVTLSDEDAAENNRAGFQWLRNDRDYYLRLTDCHGLSDTPEMSDEMKEYRQKLRDLPSVTTDPWNVEWPSNPDDPDGTKY